MFGPIPLPLRVARWGLRSVLAATGCDGQAGVIRLVYATTTTAWRTPRRRPGSGRGVWGVVFFGLFLILSFTPQKTAPR